MKATQGFSLRASPCSGVVSSFLSSGDRWSALFPTLSLLEGISPVTCPQLLPKWRLIPVPRLYPCHLTSPSPAGRTLTTGVPGVLRQSSSLEPTHSTPPRPELSQLSRLKHCSWDGHQIATLCNSSGLARANTDFCLYKVWGAEQQRDQ